jgi:UDP-N-acetylmuramate--alanine ligase
VQALLGKVQDRRIITYGFNEQADIQATNIATRGLAQEFDIICRDRQTGTQSVIENLRLPMPGTYNLQNALAAIAAGLEVRAKPDQIRTALSGFAGVKRRFTHIGTVRDVDVFDDYAHHPVEIAAVLGSARAAASGRVIGVVQPHRYTRLRDLFADFCSCMNGADMVFVLPVFTAGEAPIQGFDADHLVEGLRAHGHRHAVALADNDALASALGEVVEAGDIVVCMGAGNITAIAHELPARLAEAAA